jgi:transitional endoplasmic reticulum ATPase
MSDTLSPAQRCAFAGLMNGLGIGNLFVVAGGVGKGKTTVLQEVHRAVPSVFLTMRDFMDAIRHENPIAIEETFFQMMLGALNHNDVVILDDLHLINDVVCDCGFTTYPRKGLLNAPLTTLASYTASAGKKLIIGCKDGGPGPIQQRSYPFTIQKFQPEDYAFLGQAYLDEAQTAKLDFQKIHRFAPKLNAHQLKGAYTWLRTESDLNTEQFLDYLRSQQMLSNVQLSEVQAVDLHDLKGVDDVIASLEANIILPLENDALSTELNIRPKRGVLLAGPPGTGKTTVGRALAHRLKSKFFLIDGTFISGTRQFYEQVHQVFEAAKQNAPSIIFVDDSDVIFESGQEMGLYRYLLTMLDGLESESAGRVCVMMTAMNVGNLPPALIRSGRIELWLETRLPEESARAAILREQVLKLPPVFGKVDIAQLATVTDGMTGADLKRLVEDGKILYAYDKAQQRPLLSATEYFLSAVETVRSNKERYAEAEAMARQQRPSRPPWFDMAAMMGMGAGEEEE